MMMLKALPALFAGFLAATSAVHAAEEPPRQISVQGEGVATAAPDLAVLNFSVTARADEASKAFTEVNRKMNAVLDAIDRLGVAKRDRQTAGLRLNPVYDNRRYDDQRPRKLLGYDAATTLTVRLRNLERAGAVIDAAVKAGANGLDGFSFGFDDPKEMLDEARIAAVKDARAKAKMMAEAAGARLGPVLSIEAYDSNPRPEAMAMMARSAPVADAAPVIEAGEQSMRIRVNARFALK